MKNLSDQELMELVKLKRHAALSVLYDRYGSLVFSYAWRVMREEAAARDIVQSVFLRLWTTEAVFDPGKGKFSSWLLVITRNIATDAIRKKRRETQEIVEIEPDGLARIPDRAAPSPEDTALRRSTNDQVRRALSHLSKPQATLLEHFYWQGYSLSELARLYEEPLGTVKNRLHQALKILRKHLQTEGDSG